MHLTAVLLLQFVGTHICQSTTAVLKQWMKFLTKLMHTTNSSQIGSVAKLEGRATVAIDQQSAPQLASTLKRISLERPQSQGVHRILRATALKSIVFDMRSSIIMSWNSRISQCDRHYATAVATAVAFT